MLKQKHGQKRALNTEKKPLNIRTGCVRTPSTDSDTPLKLFTKSTSNVLSYLLLTQTVFHEVLMFIYYQK